MNGWKWYLSRSITRCSWNGVFSKMLFGMECLPICFWKSVVGMEVEMLRSLPPVGWGARRGCIGGDVIADAVSEDKDEASVTRKENRRMRLARAWNGCCQRQAMKRNCSFKSRDSSRPWWGLRGNNVEGAESYRRKTAKAPRSQRLDNQIFKEKNPAK